MAGHILPASEAESTSCFHQLSLFEDPLSDGDVFPDPLREHRLQEALISIKERYGKNAILRGLNFEPGATARERNRQIGGHRA